jgi:hypothetical protein
MADDKTVPFDNPTIEDIIIYEDTALPTGARPSILVSNLSSSDI